MTSRLRTGLSEFDFEANGRPPTTAIVLAAHGSPVDPLVNREVEAIGDRLGGLSLNTEIHVAFHYGFPSYRDVLSNIEAKRVIVIPLLTSRGYFWRYMQSELTAGLEKSPGLEIKIEEPIGVDKHVAKLFAIRIRQRLRELAWEPKEVSVLVGGHGSRKSPTSRNSTFRLVDSLKQHFGTSRTLSPLISSGFVDDDPTLSESLKAITRPKLLVLPFLISNGPHVRSDIPKGLGLPEKTSRDQAMSGCVGDKEILIDQPFGAWSAFDQLILMQAKLALCSSFAEGRFA